MPGPVAAERVGVRAEPARELERDALHRDGEREDRERLGQLALGDRCTTSTPKRSAAPGDLVDAVGARAAAVERDERVARPQRHGRPVQQLLGREPLGRDVARSRAPSARPPPPSTRWCPRR